jgi:hypothetical protein
LVKRIIELAKQYGRYGYRRVTGLLRMEGWHRVTLVKNMWKDLIEEIHKIYLLKEFIPVAQL